MKQMTQIFVIAVLAVFSVSAQAQSKAGRISIIGSNITFDFAPGKRMYQTCIKPTSRNDTMPAQRKTYPFRLERDQYGLQLCTIDGGKDGCIRRKRV